MSNPKTPNLAHLLDGLEKQMLEEEYRAMPHNDIAAELADKCRWTRVLRYLIAALMFVGIAASMAWCSVDHGQAALRDEIERLKSPGRAEWKAEDNSVGGKLVVSPSGVRYFDGDPCPKHCDDYVDGYTHGKTLGISKWRGCFDATKPEAFVSGCLYWVQDNFDKQRYDGADERGGDGSITGRY